MEFHCTNCIAKRLNQNKFPSYSTVTKWAAEFRRGRECIEDDERSGRLKEETLRLCTVWSCVTGGEICEI